MPTETIEHKSGAASIEAPATGGTDAVVDRDATRPQADPRSTPASNQGFTRWRRLLIGVLGALVIASAVYGIPWIRFVLSTVSTDDAFVNGHAPGAVAFKRDLPNSEIHLLDAGHFALDEKNDDIASLVLAFLAKHSV